MRERQRGRWWARGGGQGGPRLLFRSNLSQRVHADETTARGRAAANLGGRAAAARRARSSPQARHRMKSAARSHRPLKHADHTLLPNATRSRLATAPRAEACGCVGAALSGGRHARSELRGTQPASAPDRSPNTAATQLPTASPRHRRDLLTATVLFIWSAIALDSANLAGASLIVTNTSFTVSMSALP